jgi:carboxypeptidase Taq
MLPSGSAPARAFHKAALAGVLHEKKTNPSLDVLLPVLASPNVLELLPSPEARANVRLAHKEWELQKKKSKEMTAREAALEGRGYAAWVSAREKDEFHHGFLPVLQDIVALKKEVATATRPGWDTYDANLDLFEPGMTVRRLTEIFGALKTDLVPLLQQIMVRAYRKFLGGAGNIPARDRIFLGDSWGHWGRGGRHAPAACRGRCPPTA